MVLHRYLGPMNDIAPIPVPGQPATTERARKPDWIRVKAPTSPDWDVTADGVIAALLCGWVAQKLVQAMDLFAGQKTGLPHNANLVAIVVMAAVALRVTMEHFSVSTYPRRLQQVEGEDPPPPLLISSILGAFVRTAIFGFAAGTRIDQALAIAQTAGDTRVRFVYPDIASISLTEHAPLDQAKVTAWISALRLSGEFAGTRS